MLIAKSDQLINIVTKLAEDVHILKSGKGVLVVATSPTAATSPVAAIPSVATTPPPAARVLVDENTPNMPTNDGYWYNSNEGDGVPNDGNDGHTHSSPANEDNSTPMEMNEVVGIVGEPLDAGVSIKAPMEGKYMGLGKRIVRRIAAYRSPFIPQCIKQFRHLTKTERSVGDYAFVTDMDDE